jgi:hypothetical protein
MNATINALTGEFCRIWADQLHGGALLVAGLAALVLEQYATWDEVTPEELAAHRERLDAARDEAAELAEENPLPAEELEAVA